MSRLLLLLITFASALFLAAADSITIPEIEGPRTAYHQALAKILAERDQKAADAVRTYAARLQDLHKKLTEEGDIQAAEAVKVEADRVAKGVEPTNEERRKMTGLLLATRVLYEKNRGPAYMAAAKSEAQAHEAWAAGLAQLEQHLIRQRQFAKVTVVKAEQARLEQTKAAAAQAVALAAGPVEKEMSVTSNDRPISDLRTSLNGTTWKDAGKWKDAGGTVTFKKGIYNKHWKYETPSSDKVTIIWNPKSKLTLTLDKDGKTLLQNGKPRFELITSEPGE